MRLGIAAILGISGLLPALVILVLLRFDQGNLVVLGQEVGAYDLSRLTATLTSIVIPVLTLLPLALINDQTQKFSPTMPLAPFFLLFPTVLAGAILGAEKFVPCLVALVLLAVWLSCLHLWLLLLGRFMRARTVTVFYALAWAASGYLEHLRLYILPYFEALFLKAVAQIWWLLPQISGGPHHVDEYLQAGSFSVMPFLPTFLQLPLLMGGLAYLNSRPKEIDQE